MLLIVKQSTDARDRRETRERPERDVSTSAAQKSRSVGSQGHQ